MSGNQKTTSFFKLKQTKVIIGCLILILVIYIAGCIFYQNKFLAQTTINDIDVSSMSYQQASETLEKKLTNQMITLEFIDNQSETLKDNECGISYNQNSDLQKVLKQQNAFLWFTHFFHKTNIDIDNLLNIDESKLHEALQNLEHMQEDMQVAPVNAKVTYQDQQFSIQKETFGSQINNDQLFNIVKKAFEDGQHQINVKDAKGYNEPEISSDDQNLKHLLELANQYCQAKITYQTVDGNITLDGEDLIQWLSIDEKGQYYYSEEEFKKNAEKFVKSLAKKINIKSTPITFKGVNGTRTVSGGNYGYTLDQDAEVKGLLNDIKNQEHKTRKPEVSGVQASYSNGGIGNTFVEIDMTKQHFWYVKNGKVVLESDVVTGLPSDPDRKTPGGVYYVYFMQRDRVLRGQIQPDGKPEYETPVAYWMAFNRGIGLHDATWQSKFGGDVYKTRGSHGCINLPKNVAASLYEQLKVKTPVVCYY